MVAPYKRTGLMTASFQGARGAALSEGIRSANALTSQLNQMSNFFFNQATRQREIEGTEYGSANAPTIEQIAEATKTGESLVDFSPTVFGQAAKRAALAQIENEIIVDSTKRFDELVFTAQKNMSSPSVLRDDLDAAIIGYNEILNATSPSLANKMKAKLALTAHGQFDAYRKSYQRAAAKASKSISDEALISHLTNIPKTIQSLLSEPKTKEQLTNALLLNKIEYISALTGTVSQKRTQIKNYDQTVKEALVNIAVRNLSSLENNNLSDDIENIDNGKPLTYDMTTIDDPDNPGRTIEVSSEIFATDEEKQLFEQSKSIIESLDIIEQPKVADKLRQIRNDRIALDAQQNQIEDQKTENRKRQIINRLNELESPLISEDAEIRQSSLSLARELIDELRINLGLTDLAETYEQSYLRGFAPVTDDAALNTINNLIDTGQASFDTLVGYKIRLDEDDYNAAKAKIIARENKEVKAAIRFFGTSEGFSYSPEIDALQSFDPEGYKSIRKQLYADGVFFIEQEFQKAQDENLSFNGLGLAKEFVKNNIKPLTDQFLENNLDDLINKIKKAKTLLRPADKENNEIQEIFDSVIKNQSPRFQELQVFLSNAMVSKDYGQIPRQQFETFEREVQQFIKELDEFRR
jgi:hypothetical protein